MSNEQPYRTTEEVAGLMARNDMTRAGINTRVFEGGKVGVPSESNAFVSLGYTVNNDGMYVSKGYKSRHCRHDI